MPIVMLKDGPLSGKMVTIAVSDRTYSDRSAGQHVMYDETEANDPITHLRIFTYRKPVSRFNPIHGESNA